MADAMALDHVVINVRAGMDAAEKLISGLGFTLTPRGYHTLGSINALTIFGTNYLELLGVPPEKPDARPELTSAPVGLNGLVFKTTDADATHAHLVSLGISADPPKSFSRPVDLGDGEARAAAFRTVTVPATEFPAGRLYFCEHATPDLVWRPEWQRHDNGTAAIVELTLVAAEPDAISAKLAAILTPQKVVAEAGGGHILRWADGFSLVVQRPKTYSARFGADAVDLQGRTEAFAALAYDAPLPPAIRAHLAARPETFTVRDAEGHTRVTVRALNTLLLFPA
ncbi:MAG: VOC family protein [Hyphomicrobiaceae bacterium]|nr:VOC family protein [Hyphomicrobiaceae bacterium]